MAKQYDFRHQKQHPAVPSDSVQPVRGRLYQESRNPPLSLADDTFTRSASPTFPALASYSSSPEQPPTTQDKTQPRTPKTTPLTQDSTKLFIT